MFPAQEIGLAKIPQGQVKIIGNSVFADDILYSMVRIQIRPSDALIRVRTDLHGSDLWMIEDALGLCDPRCQSVS